MTISEELFSYVKEKYDIEPDYPLPTAPDFPVLRRKGNQKWFAIIMDAPAEKFGGEPGLRVDVLDVKIKDPMLREMLMKESGCFPGYHLNRGGWISVLLDGSVPLENLYTLIDESYASCASGRKKDAGKPREWLVPVNPAWFDIEHAFDHKRVIIWKQGRGIHAGDTVYLYVGAPVSAILYQCIVAKTDIPYNYSDEHVTMHAVMKIRLKKRYDARAFPFAKLKSQYGITAIRGPRGLSEKLSQDLRK